MLISQLPTARLRARALELSKGRDVDLCDAFRFTDAPETEKFWDAVYEQEWLMAMRLHPSLFELDTAELDESVAMLEGALNV